MGATKMGYIWQLNKRKESEGDDDDDGETEKGDEREEEKALSHEQYSSLLLPILCTTLTL